ncbi:MAG: TlpA family protein disulfide reductase [Gammaproteobacteria bacterium]|nr:TlpA family protein disulfide reductase [Gammaproteobacteria bacterium]
MSRAPNPIVATVVLSVIAIAVYAGIRLMPAGNTVSQSALDVRTLPEFSMPDLNGTDTSIQSWPGQALVVNFWATWCAPCLREIPMLKAYQQQHPEVQIVGIALDTGEAVQAFAEDIEFNYPILVGSGGFEAAAALGAEYVALPLTVFVAADARVYGTHMGELHAEHLEEFTAANAGLASGTLDFSAAQALIAAVE